MRDGGGEERGCEPPSHTRRGRGEKEGRGRREREEGKARRYNDQVREKREKKRGGGGKKICKE